MNCHPAHSLCPSHPPAPMECSWQSEAAMVERINKRQSLWKAADYPQWHGRRVAEVWVTLLLGSQPPVGMVDA